MVTGRKMLAEKLKQSEQNIRTALKLLAKQKIITIKVTNEYSIITLVNYKKYQSRDGYLTSTSTNPQPTPNQPLTTDKELVDLQDLQEQSNKPLSADAEAKAATASKGKELRDYFWAEYRKAFGRDLTWTHGKDIIQRERSLVEAQGIDEAKRLARNYIASTFITSPTYRAFLVDPDKYNVPMMKYATGPKSDYESKRGKAQPQPIPKTMGEHFKLPF